MIKGHYLIEEGDGLIKKWRRSELDTADFLTLIRNIVNNKIINISFIDDILDV